MQGRKERKLKWKIKKTGGKEESRNLEEGNEKRKKRHGKHTNDKAKKRKEKIENRGKILQPKKRSHKWYKKEERKEELQENKEK